jgi:hypothetical protein
MHKSIFTTNAQAGDCGSQAIPELSTIDAHTLLLHVGTAIITKSANLSELGKPFQAWIGEVADVLPHAGSETIASRLNTWTPLMDVSYARRSRQLFLRRRT